MNLLLLFLHLASTVRGIFTGETPPVVHETEEENFTLRWDSLTQTNMSVTNMICSLLRSPPKVLYETINGAEIQESQDRQFSGRVQVEGDAVREGRLRLHLSRLTTEDSGSYRCDLDAGYNQVLRRWEQQASVTFVLNVTNTSHGDSSVSLITPQPYPDNKQPSKVGIVPAVFILALLILYIVIQASLRSLGRKCKEMNFMINRSADCPPSTSAPAVYEILIL